MAIENPNRKTSIVSPNFVVRDSVLVCTPSSVGHKVTSKWRRPCCNVAATSPLLYIVEQLGTNKQRKIYCMCKMRYSTRLDGTDVLKEILELADRKDEKYEVLGKYWILHR